MSDTGAPPGAVERLAATGTELWWDSSPLVFAAWLEETVAKAPTERQAALREQLGRMFRSDDPSQSLVRGVTTNPPLSLAVVNGDRATWDRWPADAIKERPRITAAQLCWELSTEVVRRGADLLQPLFEASRYRAGYICGQVDPRILQDTDGMVAQGIALNRMARNISVKMPGTWEGIEGVRQLTARGIPTTVTLVFTVAQLIAVAEAVAAGLVEARANGVDLIQWRALGVMMLGRFEDAQLLQQHAAELGLELSESDRRWAGIAVFKKAYRLYRERGYATKLLGASMRLGPTLSLNGEKHDRQHIWHIERLAGADAVLTIFPNIYEGWIASYQDRPIERMIDEDVPAEVLEKLLQIPYFREAYDEQGIAPEDFVRQGAVVETAAAFTQASNELEAYAAGRIAAARG